MTRIGPIAAVLFVSALGLAAARADEQPADTTGVQVGKGVVCDTEQQAQRFASLIAEHEPGDALSTVNKEADNPLACGLATVAFKPGKHVGDVHNDKGLFKIMEIKIFAAATPDGWRTVDGATQFAAIPVEGLDI
ncbi:MAG TPA: hypothetical protein VFB45_26245 [Pseudolabrys sp.]|nr:hypothetical protein [Pseudolabrys sp.]